MARAPRFFFSMTAVLVVIGAALLGSPSTASADRGVMINLGAIDIDDRLSPGGRYHLPTLVVTNIGDATENYAVTVQYMGDDARKHPPADWFRIEPAEFDLTAGESRAVRVSIELPRNAGPDEYLAMIEAQLVGGDGISVSGAAASRVSFEVRPSSQLAALWLQVKRGFGDYSPWTTVVPAGALLLVLLYMARRRLSIRIERRS
jgi:hypothetical protein